MVLIKMRMTSPQAAQEICRRARQAIVRYEEPGWIGGWCVANTEDPRDVIIVEEWGSRAAFDAWLNSPARFRYEQETARLRVGSPELEVYEEVQ